MSTRTKVVIVGAGAAGLSTAMHLTRRGGVEVTVIEKSYPAEASSGVSAGVFTRQYFDPLDIRIRVRAYEELCRLERDHGLVLIRNGFMRFAHDREALAGFEQAVAAQLGNGVEDAVMLDAAELGRSIPDLDPEGLLGAMLVPSDGYLDGQQLCMTYAELAQAQGAELKVRTGLTGYRELPGGGHELTTEQGPIECDVVVNAAGGWAQVVADLLGTTVPIRPERHQACIFELTRPLGYTLPMIMDYVPGTGVEGLYFRPEGESQLIAGLHTNDQIDAALVEDVDDFYTGADAAFVDTLIPMLVERMPGLEEIGFRSGWSGIYPNSADDRFIVGPHRDGVFSVCGLNGVGVYTSPYLGQVAAEWILDGSPSDPELAGFSPLRFAHG